MKPHVWCNNHNYLKGCPSEDEVRQCKMCQELTKSYPLGEYENEEDLVRRYFPNVVRISNV